MMLFDAPCKEGKLQVMEEGIVRITSFKRVLWQTPCQAVTGFTAQPGPMATVKLTVHTTDGTHTIEMLTQKNFTKLQSLFPNLQTTSAGREWYHDPARLTYVATYTNEKHMQREVEGAAQHGWMIQGQTGIAGHINVGRTITKAALTGGIGLMTGASRSKDKITITFVRTPEWVAQNK